MNEGTVADNTGVTHGTVAAVDLGSNSFHMVVARHEDGSLHVVDRLKERVALAEGLDEAKRLTPEIQERALSCLARFGQRLRDMPQGSVRAVGTNTLRQAKNGRKFLGRARTALGHPIEVVSGREEARLVYLGVAHAVGAPGDRRLVVDIGGGSTECVIGERFDVLRADSLYMGCVGYSLRYFPRGRITQAAMQRATVAARLELEPIERTYRALGFAAAIGSSGTVLAVEEILRLQGWSERGVTPTGLAELRRAMVEAGHADALRLQALGPDRTPVLPGGVAILSAVLESLAIDVLLPSPGALREGVLYDLLGRIQHEDVRDRTITEMARRYHVDEDQSRRVAETARSLLATAAGPWELDPDLAAQLLSWAAQLHEVGLSVAYSGHHKHGAYLVTHAEMPGFSREDQETLAALIACHRRKLRRRVFRDLPAGRGPWAERLVVLLRLAVLLNRNRSETPLPPLELTADGNALTLRFPEGWLARSPLTMADLEEERGRLEAAGYRLLLAP